MRRDREKLAVAEKEAYEDMWQNEKREEQQRGEETTKTPKKEDHASMKAKKDDDQNTIRVIASEGPSDPRARYFTQWQSGGSSLKAI